MADPLSILIFVAYYRSGQTLQAKSARLMPDYGRVSHSSVSGTLKSLDREAFISPAR